MVVNNEPVQDCAIFDSSHKCNVAAEQLMKLPTDKFHTDSENDMIFVMFKITVVQSANQSKIVRV